MLAPVADAPEVRAEILRQALRHGFGRFLVRDAAELSAEAIEGLTQHSAEELAWLRPAGRPTLPIVSLADPEDLGRAIAAGRAHQGVVIRWTAERVIPLENLLADAHGRYPVSVLVDRIRDIPAMLGALEHGADRLIVAVATPDEVAQVEASLDEVRIPSISWELVPVTRVVPAGVGDRVIVDTTSLLRPGEGMLIGSAAAFLFHVASEAVGSRFTRPRPFRVNAGAAHAYTLLADGTTRYLSELVAGDAVLVAGPQEPARSARVGRIKIERRPMVLIEAERQGRRFTTFLQEAETVRVSAESERIPTTHLAAGSRIYGAAFAPARHLGAAVDESIEER